MDDRFADVIGKHMIDKLDELYEREKAEPEFLNQKNYSSCKERALDWLDMAYAQAREQMANNAGYAIAVSREDRHGDNTMDEQAELLEAGADPSIKEKLATWWIH